MDFAGVRLKLDRATHHLDALKMSLDQFLKGDPDPAVRIAIEPDTDDRTWKATTHGPTEIPLDWSVLIGEVVYQLRSTLDHLINGLIPEATKDSAFPIYDDEGRYDTNAARLMPRLPEPYLAVVRELQPFWQNPADPKANTLWNLNEWARLDRHRFLHIADVWITSATVVSDPEGLITLDWSATFPVSFEDRAVIGRGKILPTPPQFSETKVNVEMRTSIDLVLSQIDDMRIPEGMMAVQAVQGLEVFLGHVHEIVEAFEAIVLS